MSGSTSPLGFPYLGPSDPPDIAGGLQSLAQAVQTYLLTPAVYSYGFEASGRAIATGTVTTVFGWTGGGTNNITYAGGGIWSVTVAGYYTIDGQVTFQANATGYRLGQILVNSTVVRQVTAPGNASQTTCLPMGYGGVFAVNDTIQMQCYQNSGGVVDLSTTQGQTQISIQRIGPS